MPLNQDTPEAFAIAREALGTDFQNSINRLVFRVARVMIPIFPSNFSFGSEVIKGFAPSHFPWLFIVFKK